MPYVTDDILKFYNINEKNEWYLKKYFTNTVELGLYEPYAEDVVDKYPNGDPFMVTVDEDNTYKINSLGFRGKVYENAEVLASGCSITFGLGIPESGRWTNILSNKINKDIMNLGNPGASVETMCNHIIQYCLNNKMPKEIFCLFPDFFRNMVVADKEFYKSRVKRRSDDTPKDILRLTFCNPIIMKTKDSIFMEIEDKKYIEDSLSPHQLILNSINYIYMLESFCLTNNIKLHWTTWDLPSSIIMEKLTKIKNFKLKNFLMLLPPNAEETFNFSLPNICSLSHDSEFKNTMYWDKGSDYSIINYKKDRSTAHPGIHFQEHVAELFYNLYRKDNENN